MSNYSRLSRPLLGTAPFGALLAFAGTLGCSDDAGGLSSGSSGGAASAGTGGKGSAGMSTSGATGASGTAGLGGSSAGSSSTAGSSGAGTAGAGGAMAGAGGIGGTGGAGGTSGAGGSPGSGGGPDCSSLKLCEDFEKEALDAATWSTKVTGTFSAKIDTDQAHRGTRSLHIVAPNAANSAFITETKTFPAADFWGRAWFRITGPKGGHQVYIIAKPSAANSELRLFNRKADKEEMAVNVQNGDDWFVTTTPVPQATWFCYEWHVTEKATTIYHDGTEAVFGANKPPGMKGATSLSLGWQRWQQGAAGEMWIDDVAIADKQIGCK